MSADAGRETIELLDQTWRTIAELCDGLDADGYRTPTDCPGWTVKDMLSHILGTERALRGEPPPDVVTAGAHVRNELGRFNEQWVESRRAASGPDVLAEFREVTAAQIVDRRRLAPAALIEIVPTPFGEMPLWRWLDIRLFDSFSHEQDIRRALGKPGNLDGEQARRAARRGVDGLPRAVGKAARGRPDGLRVEVVVEGDLGGSWVVVVNDGRGAFSEDEGPIESELRMDLDTFLRLVWGRVAVSRVENNGRLQLTGSLDLGRRVAAGLIGVP